jgi:hypothetical protein
MMAKSQTSKAAATKSGKHDPKALPVTMKPDDEITKVIADMAAGGLAANAYLLQRYSEGTLGKDQVSLAGCIESLATTAKQAHGGDLKKAETMLVAQAATLNAVFCELARRSALNMGEYLGAAETYMRLALKAQAQCRATLETLATIKNPPVVFARQANINNGGQQQVNNGAAPASAPDPARAANLPAAPTGLLERNDGERMDTGATCTASGADPHMEAVGAVNRPAHR